jgi:hypothetical protein
MLHITKKIPVYIRSTQSPIKYVHLIVDNASVVEKCRDIFLYQTQEGRFTVGGYMVNGKPKVVDIRIKGVRSLNKFIGGEQLINKQRIRVARVFINNLSGCDTYDYSTKNFRVKKVSKLKSNTSETIIDEKLSPVELIQTGVDVVNESDLIPVEILVKTEPLVIRKIEKVVKPVIVETVNGISDISIEDIVTLLITRLRKSRKITHELHSYSNDNIHSIELHFKS